MKLNLSTFLHSKNITTIFQKKELLFHPSREWISGLFFGILLFGAAVFFIVLDFYIQFYIPEENVEIPVQAIEYNAKEVRSFAEKYNTKEQMFNTLRESRAFVPATTVVEDSATGTISEILPSENTALPPLADDAGEQ